MSTTTQLEVPRSDKTTLGFWIYIMSDCVLFASLFATYAVLQGNSVDGHNASELFNLPFVLGETILLLTSSFTCGLMLLSARFGLRKQALIWLGATFLLGLSFLGMELYEFTKLVQEGNSWQQSGFLSAFFTLVGTHGLHITVGLIWLAVMGYILYKKPLTSVSVKRLTLLSLFWHFLDVVWIFIFTFVYLIGVGR